MQDILIWLYSLKKNVNGQMPNAIEISAVDSFCAIRAIDGAKQIKTLAFGGEASTNRVPLNAQACLIR